MSRSSASAIPTGGPKLADNFLCIRQGPKQAMLDCVSPRRDPNRCGRETEAAQMSIDPVDVAPASCGSAPESNTERNGDIRAILDPRGSRYRTVHADPGRKIRHKGVLLELFFVFHYTQIFSQRKLLEIGFRENAAVGRVENTHRFTPANLQ